MMYKLLIRVNFKKTAPLFILLFFNLFAVLSQDKIDVKGQILSSANQPLPDVSISVEGSIMMPEISNESGEFELKSVSRNAWLIISPTGDFKNKRVYLNNLSDIKIYLTNDFISSGDDIFRVLNHDIRKRNIVSAISELNVDDIHHSPAITVDQYMQGRVAGVHIVNMSGAPASGAYMSLRGVNSIYASNQPLYIVDGIPHQASGIFGSNLDGFTYNPLLSLNPYDISKLNVIKDPGLTAAYGSKASNGLIVIETLDPSVTQTTIELDLRTGYSLTPEFLIPQLNGQQHKTLMNEVLFSTGLYEEVIREYFPNLFLTDDDDRYIDYQHNTNWQELIFSNSAFTNLNLNIKGGDEIARYGLSFGYTDAEGIIKETGYQSYNLRFVSKLNIFTWLKMNAGVSLNSSSGTLKEAATVEQTSPLYTSLAKSPLLNPFQYDIEGNLLTTLAEVDELGISNPLATIQNYEARNNNYNFVSTLGFEADLTEDLSLKTNFSMNYNVLKEQLFMPNRGMELYYNSEAINVAKATNNDLSSIYNNTYLKYNKAFGSDHEISSRTGVNIQTNRFELDWGLTKNAHENDEYRSLQDGQNSLREIGGENRIWNWMSFYESFYYVFKDKYLATASLSLDGSSRVGDNALNTTRIGNVPFGFFYSGGLAWRINNESFLKNASWLEDLKFRISYGKTGNDDIGESTATNYYQAVKFRETVGLYPALIANDELTYETVSQLNTGIDISLLGNRFTTSFDIFNSTTDNMLIFSPVNAYFGYELRVENGGVMQNKGWELSTFIRVVDKASFKWDIRAYLASNKNQILEIKGDQLITSIEGAEIVNMEGKQVNSYYGYVYEGVYSTQLEADSSMLVNERYMPYMAGDAMYRDISGPEGVPDSIINKYDKTAIGSSLPELFGGIINTFTYKRWSLSASIQFVSGNEVFNYLRFQNERMTGLANQSSTVLNRWQYEGQVTDIPRALYNDPVGNSDFSTRWIEDGSYMRLKNITISYKIPNKFLAFRDAEFYVSANNLLTFSNYLGYDPEFAYSGSQLQQGIDYGLTPQSRQFITGIKIGF